MKTFSDVEKWKEFISGRSILSERKQKPFGQKGHQAVEICLHRSSALAWCQQCRLQSSSSGSAVRIRIRPFPQHHTNPGLIFL